MRCGTIQTDAHSHTQCIRIRGQITTEKMKSVEKTWKYSHTNVFIQICRRQTHLKHAHNIWQLKKFQHGGVNNTFTSNSVMCPSNSGLFYTYTSAEYGGHITEFGVNVLFTLPCWKFFSCKILCVELDHTLSKSKHILTRETKRTLDDISSKKLTLDGKPIKRLNHTFLYVHRYIKRPKLSVLLQLFFPRRIEGHCS